MLTATTYADWLVTHLEAAADAERNDNIQRRIPDSDPLAVTVIRHQCPHCRRTWAKREAATAHIARCWKNPAVRACKTCVHYDLGGDACGCEPGCNWGASGPQAPSCDLGLPLGPNYQPATDCPLWSPPSDHNT